MIPTQIWKNFSVKFGDSNSKFLESIYKHPITLCFAHTVLFFDSILTSTTAPSPVNLVSFVIFELLGGAVAAGLFRLTEMETTAAKDEKVKMGMWLGTLPWN